MRVGARGRPGLASVSELCAPPPTPQDPLPRTRQRGGDSQPAGHAPPALARLPGPPRLCLCSRPALGQQCGPTAKGSRGPFLRRAVRAVSVVSAWILPTWVGAHAKMTVGSASELQGPTTALSGPPQAGRCFLSTDQQETRSQPENAPASRDPQAARGQNLGGFWKAICGPPGSARLWPAGGLSSGLPRGAGVRAALGGWPGCGAHAEEVSCRGPCLTCLTCVT